MQYGYKYNAMQYNTVQYKKILTNDYITFQGKENNLVINVTSLLKTHKLPTDAK
jgi:hypothetical protein